MVASSIAGFCCTDVMCVIYTTDHLQQSCALLPSLSIYRSSIATRRRVDEYTADAIRKSGGPQEPGCRPGGKSHTIACNDRVICSTYCTSTGRLHQ